CHRRNTLAHTLIVQSALLDLRRTVDVDRQNASALSTQASIALRATPRHTDPEHHQLRSQGLLLPLANLPQFGHLAGGDDLRARVEAMVYQARAQRAADLGEFIGVGLVAVDR